MNKIKVKQYTKSGEYVKTWNSALEAEMYYSTSLRNHGKIGQVCNGKRKIAYGYFWRKESDNISKKEIILMFKEKNFSECEVKNLFKQKIDNNNFILPSKFWKNDFYNKIKIAASLFNGNRHKFLSIFNVQYKRLDYKQKKLLNEDFFPNYKKKNTQNKSIKKQTLKQWPSKEEIAEIVSHFEGTNEFRYSSKENKRLFWYAWVKTDWYKDFKFKSHELTIGEEQNVELRIKRDKNALTIHFNKISPEDGPYKIELHMIGHCYGYTVINKYNESITATYSRLINRNYLTKTPSPERRCVELKKYFENMHETNEEITVKYHIKKNEKTYLYDIYVSDVCWHRNISYNKLIKRATLFKYDLNGNIMYPRNYWTEEHILDAMKSCKTSNPRTEFTDKFPGAVRPAYKLKMFTRFAYIWDNNTKDDNNVYIKTQEWKVYLYSSEKDKSAYVGLTRNRLSIRDYSHRHMSKGKYDNVYEYYNGNIPKIQLLVSGIKTKEDAQYYEDLYKSVFKHMGYYIINKAKTGIGTGSTGPCYPRVSDQNLIDTIPQNVKTLKELKVIDNKLANRISQRKLVEESGLVKYAYTIIYAFTIDGKYVGEFFSFEKCAKELFDNKHLGQKIRRICDGGGDVNAMTLKGYTFSYDRNGYINPKEKKKTKRGYKGQRVAQIKDRKIIRIELNAESYRNDGFDPHNIRAVCRDDKHSHKGYIWRYVNDNDEIITPEELKQNKKSEV